MRKQNKRSCPGIYAIYNVISDKIYIGQSKDVNYRLKFHEGRLRNGNCHNSILSKSWAKHGKNAFVFRAIELCAREDLDRREMYWIAQYQSTDRKHGYNMQMGGTVLSELTKEHKDAIGNSLRGKKLSAEGRANMKRGQIARAAKDKGMTPDEYLRWKESAKLDRVHNKLARIQQAYARKQAKKPPMTIDERRKIYASKEYRDKLKAAHARIDTDEWRKKVSDGMKRAHMERMALKHEEKETGNNP